MFLAGRPAQLSACEKVTMEKERSRSSLAPWLKEGANIFAPSINKPIRIRRVGNQPACIRYMSSNIRSTRSRRIRCAFRTVCRLPWRRHRIPAAGMADWAWRRQGSGTAKAPLPKRQEAPLSFLSWTLSLDRRDDIVSAYESRQRDPPFGLRQLALRSSACGKAAEADETAAEGECAGGAFRASLQP